MKKTEIIIPSENLKKHKRCQNYRKKNMNVEINVHCTSADIEMQSRQKAFFIWLAL